MEEEEDEETLIQRALEMSMKDVNAPVEMGSSSATAMEVRSSIYCYLFFNSCSLYTDGHG